MVEGKLYKIEISKPAKNRYHEIVLPYIYDNFSFERAIEIDENILKTVETLSQKPNRGTTEKYLEEARELFKFILHKETKHFELKIIYYINENKSIVYVTDFFPTKMNPQRITKNN